MLQQQGYTSIYLLDVHMRGILQHCARNYDTKTINNKHYKGKQQKPVHRFDFFAQFPQLEFQFYFLLLRKWVWKQKPDGK